MTQTEKKKPGMKNGIKKITGAKWFVPVALTLIIAMQIGYLCYIFFAEKTSYHCDEVYSYGLANNFYGAYLESDNVYSHEGYHSNEWVSGELFRNYITVQPSERFRYDSVWYNQSQDRHPPLFYAFIHTISSFMPDQFSFVPGFILNLVIFAVTQVFLYLLAKNLLRSRYLALLYCLFWGFTMAAVDITIFIRMYCMLTMWVVILMYLHSRLYKAGDKPSPGLFAALGIITALGGLTQYLFYFIAFITTVIFCIYFLINKRWKTFLIYGISMLLGVVAAFVIYPSSYRQLFSEGDNAIGVDFFKQLPFSLRYISGDIYRLTDLEIVWFARVVPVLLAVAVIFSLPLLFLFRKSERLRGFFRSVKTGVASLPKKLKSITPSKIWAWVKAADPIPFIIFMCSVIIVVVVSYSIPFITGYCNRYFYPLLPLIALLVMVLLKYIFKNGITGKIVLTSVTALMIVHIVFFSPLTSLWTKRNDINFRELTSGCNVAIIYNNDFGYDSMSTFSYELYNADQVFFSTHGDILKHEKEISRLGNDKPVYVMIHYDNCKNDENGTYITEVQNIERRIYISDLLQPFDKINGANGYDYIGMYSFIEGDFLIYKIKRGNE